jgi:SAM-dependent methyltransferase
VLSIDEVTGIVKVNSTIRGLKQVVRSLSLQDVSRALADGTARIETDRLEAAIKEAKRQLENGTPLEQLNMDKLVKDFMLTTEQGARLAMALHPGQGIGGAEKTARLPAAAGAAAGEEKARTIVSMLQDYVQTKENNLAALESRISSWRSGLERMRQSKDLSEKERRKAEAMLRSMGMTEENAQSQLKKAKSELDTARARIKQIEQIAQKPIGDQTVEEFIRALREAIYTEQLDKEEDDLIFSMKSMTKGARQERVLEAVEKIISDNPDITFSPELTLFIPASSWVHDWLIGADYRAGATMGRHIDIVDNRGRISHINVISERLVNLIDIARVVIHEEVHETNRGVYRAIPESSAGERALFRLLNEANTEKRTNTLLVELAMSDPKFKFDFLSKLNKQERDQADKIKPEDKAALRAYLGKATKTSGAAYVYEQEILGTICRVFPGAEKSIDKFLKTGDAAELKNILGAIWESLLELAVYTQTRDDASAKFALEGMNIALQHPSPSKMMEVVAILVRDFYEGNGQVIPEIVLYRAAHMAIQNIGKESNIKDNDPGYIGSVLWHYIWDETFKAAVREGKKLLQATGEVDMDSLLEKYGLIDAEEEVKQKLAMAIQPGQGMGGVAAPLIKSEITFEGEKILAKLGLDINNMIADPGLYMNEAKIRSLSPEENRALIAFLWQRAGIEGLKIPDSLIDRILSSRQGWWIYSIATCQINPETIRGIKEAINLPKEEEYFLWQIFHRVLPRASNREEVPPVAEKVIEDAVSSAVAGQQIQVLDIGCGPHGRAIARLKEKLDAARAKAGNVGPEVAGWGLDLDIADNASTNVRLMAGDARALPSEWTDKFDVIYESYVMEYFTTPQEFKQVMAEILRVLKPGGKFVFSDGISSYFHDHVFMAQILSELGATGNMRSEKNGEAWVIEKVTPQIPTRVKTLGPSDMSVRVQRAGDMMTFTARLPGGPAGNLIVKRVLPGKNIWYGDQITVAEEVQRQGIGSELYRAAAEEIERNGGVLLAALTLSDTGGQQTIDKLTKMGFTEPYPAFPGQDMPRIRIRPTAVSIPAQQSESISLPADILALLETKNIDRVVLVHVMADKVNGIDDIRMMLSAIESVPIDQQRELEMALRTAVALKGLGDLTPANLNVVVQVAPLEQANAATTYTRQIEDKLMRRFNGVSTKSIIGRGIDDNDVDGLAALIAQAKKSMEADKNPQQARALLLLPALPGNLASRQKIVNVAMEKAGAMQNGVAEPRFRIQFIEQGNMPDTVTQFELGVEILEHTRSLEKDVKAEPSQRLLNLIAAMVEGAVDPRVVINELFKGILKIRKIDWRTVDEQRKSWEAVATAL